MLLWCRVADVLALSRLVCLCALVLVMTGAGAVSPGQRKRPRKFLGARARPRTGEDYCADVGPMVMMLVVIGAGAGNVRVGACVGRVGADAGRLGAGVCRLGAGCVVARVVMSVSWPSWYKVCCWCWCW